MYELCTEYICTTAISKYHIIKKRSVLYSQRMIPISFIKRLIHEHPSTNHTAAAALRFCNNERPRHYSIMPFYAYFLLLLLLPLASAATIQPSNDTLPTLESPLQLTYTLQGGMTITANITPLTSYVGLGQPLNSLNVRMRTCTNH